MENLRRYLRLMIWAKRRYTRDGYIAYTMGGWPYRYSLLEDMAASQIMGCKPSWPELRLCDAIPHKGDPWPAVRALMLREEEGQA